MDTMRFRADPCHRPSGTVALALAILALPCSLAAQELPLGDGHVTDHPEAGSVYACRRVFRGGGARHEGAWFHGDTWDPAQKPHVSGHVLWPEASFRLSPGDGQLVFKGNGLPLEEPTGRFPITPSDSVYRYDTNPNRVGAQQLDFEIPLHPVTAAEPGCLPMGMIGFTVTGVALYSALDDAGRDAAAHEIQDECDGHPQANSEYHYHSGSPCIPGIESDSLVGWALDGFPILGTKDAQGRFMTDRDLDACHGRAEHVVVDGRSYEYAYRVTREYPYTLGCFSGPLLESTLQDAHAGLQPPRRRPGRGRRGGGPGGR
jgi:hypothetical protein